MGDEVNWQDRPDQPFLLAKLSGCVEKREETQGFWGCCGVLRGWIWCRSQDAWRKSRFKAGLICLGQAVGCDGISVPEGGDRDQGWS